MNSDQKYEYFYKRVTLCHNILSMKDRLRKVCDVCDVIAQSLTDYQPLFRALRLNEHFAMLHLCRKKENLKDVTIHLFQPSIYLFTPSN